MRKNLMAMIMAGLMLVTIFGVMNVSAQAVMNVSAQDITKSENTDDITEQNPTIGTLPYIKIEKEDFHAKWLYAVGSLGGPARYRLRVTVHKYGAGLISDLNIQLKKELDGRPIVTICSDASMSFLGQRVFIKRSPLITNDGSDYILEYSYSARSSIFGKEVAQGPFVVYNIQLPGPF